MPSCHRWACAFLVSVLVLPSLAFLGSDNAVATDSEVWNQTSGNLASTNANWLDGTKPIAGAAVIFNSTSTAACTWDLTLILASFTVQSGYTGTITPSVDFGTTGAFTPCVSGSTFIAGKYNYSIGGSWTGSPGTMTIGTATLIFTGAGAHTLTVSSSSAGKIGNISIPDGGTVTISTSTLFYWGTSSLHPIIYGANGAIINLPMGKTAWIAPSNMTNQPFTGSGSVIGGGAFRIRSDHTHNPTIFSAGGWTFGVGLIFNAETAYSTTIALGSDITDIGKGISTLGEAYGNITLDTAGYGISCASWGWSWLLTSTHRVMLRDSIVNIASTTWGWDTSAVTLVANTSTVILNGAGPITTNAGSSFYNLAVNGVFTTGSSINVSHTLTIGTTGVLNVSAGHTLMFNVSDLFAQREYEITINSDIPSVMESDSIGILSFTYIGVFSIYYFKLDLITRTSEDIISIIGMLMALGIFVSVLIPVVQVAREKRMFKPDDFIHMAAYIVISISLLEVIYAILS